MAQALGANARYAQLDVTSEADWNAAMAVAQRELGGLHVLVNNAAVLDVAALVDTPPKEFEWLLRVNLYGPFLGIRAGPGPMREAGGGSIVNIASIDAPVAQGRVSSSGKGVSVESVRSGPDGGPLQGAVCPQKTLRVPALAAVRAFPAVPVLEVAPHPVLSVVRSAAPEKLPHLRLQPTAIGEVGLGSGQEVSGESLLAVTVPPLVVLVHHGVRIIAARLEKETRELSGQLFCANASRCPSTNNDEIKAVRVDVRAPSCFVMLSAQQPSEPSRT